MPGRDRDRTPCCFRKASASASRKRAPLAGATARRGIEWSVYTRVCDIDHRTFWHVTIHAPVVITRAQLCGSLALVRCRHDIRGTCSGSSSPSCPGTVGNADHGMSRTTNGRRFRSCSGSRRVSRRDWSPSFPREPLTRRIQTYSRTAVRRP